MFVKVFLASIPFLYVQQFRYYQGTKVFSYIFGELSPMLFFYVLYAEHYKLLDFFSAWLFFWTFYEIGYLINDCKSVNSEAIPTRRAPKEVCKYLHQIIAFRVFLIAVQLVLILWITSIDPYRLGLLTLLIAGVFLIHNVITDYKMRFFTLIILGFLKPTFIFYVNSVAFETYLYILIPFLVIKYLDYLYQKDLLKYDIAGHLRLRFLFFSLWAIPVLLIGLKGLIVYLFIYLNFNKRYLFNMRGSCKSL